MRLAIVVSLAALMSSGCVFHSHKPLTATLTGRVIDRRTGWPVSEASVYLHGTHIGTVANSEGRFELKRVPRGTYDCLVSGVGYRAVREKIQFEVGQRSSRDIRLMNMSLLGLYAREVTITETYDLQEGCNWQYSEKIDSPLYSDTDKELLRQVTAFHLRNLEYFVCGNADSLTEGVSPDYLDIIAGASGRNWGLDVTQLQPFFDTELFHRFHDRPLDSLVRVANPEAVLVSGLTDWSRINSLVASRKASFIPGDVIVHFLPGATSPLPNGWFGVYRQIDGRWIMIAGAFPCCRY